MDTIETDYLIVGSGASGMAFADTLLSETSYEFVLTDRRSQPGGHWVDTYPFVQLHQPSAYYGVNSVPLGNDTIDTSGVNAGFYERATGAEIQYYYQRVLSDVFMSSGRVTHRPAHDYLGEEDGAHILRSNLNGDLTRVKVRRSLVDATITQSSVPSRHTPSFNIEQGVSFVTPNTLVNVVGARGYTVIGASKTSMDVCFWLLQQGVAPDKITWVRPREVWMGNRASTQPLAMAANMMRAGALSMQAAAEADDANDYALRMEAEDMMFRLDRGQNTPINRGAVISQPELTALRSIERVVRKGYVRSIQTTKLIFDQGELTCEPGQVFVDCTAAGLSSASPRPIFEPGKINVFFTTRGVAPWSAALVGFVESMDVSIEEIIKLCPPLPLSFYMLGILNIMRFGLEIENLRRSVSELASWSSTARLNPSRSIPDAMRDPQAQADFATYTKHYPAALENLNRICGDAST